MMNTAGYIIVNNSNIIDILEIDVLDIRMGGYMNFFTFDENDRTITNHVYLRMLNQFEILYHGKKYCSLEQLPELAMDIERIKTETAIDSLE